MFYSFLIFSSHSLGISYAGWIIQGLVSPSFHISQLTQNSIKGAIAGHCLDNAMKKIMSSFIDKQFSKTSVTRLISAAYPNSVLVSVAEGMLKAQIRMNQEHCQDGSVLW